MFYINLIFAHTNTGGVNMKKVVSIILICIFILVSCKTTNNNIDKNNATDNNLTYTTEFSFLPSHPNMEFVEIVKQGKENEYSSATYIVKNSTREQVIDEYMNILENDSWDITADKPIIINAKKDSHQAIIYINPSENSENDVSLTIVAK